MCAKKRHTSSSYFLRYLKDDLSNQERHALERSLEANPFEKEAIEGLEGISAEKAEADLLSLHASLNRRYGRRKRRTWYGIAATAASILLVGTIFLNIYDLNRDDAENEPLTEESFRDLDSGKELEAPEALDSEESLKKMEEITEPKQAKGKAEEAAAPEMVSEQVAETAQEEPVFDMEMDEDAEIVAVEAEPRRAKRTVQKENMATPEAFAPAPASEPAPKSSGQVSGVVISSEDMEPLPGASVFIRGTSSGTVADMDGRFTLPAEDSHTTVVASFIGMETEEYQLRTGGDNRLVMQPDPVTLDEVVVLAYGVVKTEEAPPSYSSAEPIGGFKPFRDYVEENMVFPEGYTPGERELVILRFTVTSSGSISNIETLSSPGEPFTRESIRLLQQGPEWSSARVNGDPIEEQVRMRIVFKR